MIDEGYIKFLVDWQYVLFFLEVKFVVFNIFWQEFYSRGLIGVYENGIGFGNISCRVESGGLFYILGFKMGYFVRLDICYYVLVIEVGVVENCLSCIGLIIVFFEFMSYVIIYEECFDVNGVIYVYDFYLWQSLMYKVLIIDVFVFYGFLEMVESIWWLLREIDLKVCKIFVMEGYEEGIFIFGVDFVEVMAVLKVYL